MTSIDARTLHELYAAGADFAAAPEKAVEETTYHKHLFMVAPETGFSTPMLKVVWSWQRWDTIQLKLSQHTIARNSEDWSGPPLPPDLPESIFVEWQGKTYEVPLMHTRTSGLDLYTDEASPFYVKPAS